MNNDVIQENDIRNVLGHVVLRHILFNEQDALIVNSGQDNDRTTVQTAFYNEAKKVLDNDPELFNSLKQDILSLHGQEYSDLSTAEGKEKIRQYYENNSYDILSRFEETYTQIPSENLEKLYSTIISNNFEMDNQHIISLKEDSIFTNSGSENSVFPALYVENKENPSYEDEYKAKCANDGKFSYNDYPSLICSLNGKKVSNPEAVSFFNEKTSPRLNFAPQKPNKVDQSQGNTTKNATKNTDKKTEEEENDLENQMKSFPSPFDNLFNTMVGSIKATQGPQGPQKQGGGRGGLFSALTSKKRESELFNEKVMLNNVREMRESFLNYQKYNKIVESKISQLDGFFNEKLGTSYSSLKEMKKNDPRAYEENIKQIEQFVNDNNIGDFIQELDQDIKKRDANCKNLQDNAYALGNKKEFTKDPDRVFALEKSLDQFNEVLSADAKNAKNIHYKNKNVNLSDNEEKMEGMKKMMDDLMKSLTAIFSRITGVFKR